MSILTAAIVGAIIGLLVAILTYFAKEQRFNKVLRTITDPAMTYAALYHYASENRYKKGFKYFDSYGVLYLVGKMLYYKTTPSSAPVQFNLNECTIQPEPDWRWLKWFSITTPSGQKHYFNSSKMGAFKNNSDETLKGLQVIQSAKSS
jgi:hypothetical protein